LPDSFEFFPEQSQPLSKHLNMRVITLETKTVMWGTKEFRMIVNIMVEPTSEYHPGEKSVYLPVKSGKLEDQFLIDSRFIFTKSRIIP
jgi:hypothetical protein